MFSPTPLKAADLRYADGEFSLTFNDGPTPEVTAKVAQMLSARGIAATFFVLGEHVKAELLKPLVEQGHQIGNHTYSHPNFDASGGRLEKVVPEQIARCHEKIKDFAPKDIPFRAPGGGWLDPKCHLAANTLPFAHRYVGPYGSHFAATNRRLSRRQGHWDKVTIDAFLEDFQLEMASKRSGIIVLHDGFPSSEAGVDDLHEIQVVEVVEYVVEEIVGRGFKFVGLKTPPQIVGAQPHGKKH